VEVSLFHAVQVATSDFHGPLKKIFGVRGEIKRINAAESLGLLEYRRLKLETEFKKALRVVRCCLKHARTGSRIT
jgi:hypothetical protein